MPSGTRQGALGESAVEPRILPPAPDGGVEGLAQAGELEAEHGDGVAGQRAPAEAEAQNAQPAEPGVQVGGGAPPANGGVAAEPANSDLQPTMLQLGQMLHNSMLSQTALQQQLQFFAQRQHTMSEASLAALQRIGRFEAAAPAPASSASAPAAQGAVPAVPLLPALAARAARSADREAGAREDAPAARVPGWDWHPDTLLTVIDENTNKLPDSFHAKIKHLSFGEGAEFKRSYKMLCRFDSWRLHLLDYLALVDLGDEQRQFAVEWLWELGDISGGDAGDTQGPMALIQARMAVLMTPANQRPSVEAYITNQDQPLDPMTLVHPGLAAMQATAVARDVTQQMRALAGSRSKEHEDDALAAERLEDAARAARAARGRGRDDYGAARGALRGGGGARGGAGRGRGRGASARHA